MGIRNRRARTHAKTHAVGFSLAGVLGFLVLLAIALAVSLGALIESWLQDLPDYTSADAYLVAEPTEVYDSDGNVIATFYLENRISVTQEEVSDYVLKGTVDIEDERFYTHNGIDPIGILRAVFAQLRGQSEGASTITQQLVRNTVLSDEQFDKTLKRKVREAYIAVEMEKTYSKDQILMMYLNTIYYGHGAYGIQAASITYFNKNASDLTLAEAATLAGLPQSPSYYDPTQNPEAATERRNLVLGNMLRLGDITQEEYDAAVAEPLTLNLGDTSLDNQGTYPFWTNYVKGLLEGDFSQDTIVQSGLKIYTTLDSNYQQQAEEAVAEYLEWSGNDELDQALVAIDPSTGYIKAMVGGRNFYGESEDSQVNAATSLRQTGSSFKVFTLAAAIKAGMSPTVRVNCNSPIQVNGGTRIQNYGNDSYGTLTLQGATALSSNTGYVQVGLAIGIEQVISTAQDMGITSDLQPYISTILGAEECSALEMAEAYATLAAGGLHRDSVAVTRIEDRNGNTVYEHEDNPTRVLSESEAKAITEVLETVVNTSQGTAYSMNNYLEISQPIAGKTGTTEYFDNLWFCGYTPQLSVAVWTGYKAGSEEVTIKTGTGHPYNTSCRTWAFFMNRVLSGVERGSWPMEDADDPSYQKNSSWSFSNTTQSQNSTNAYQEEAVPENSGGTGGDTTTTTPEDGTTTDTGITTTEPTVPSSPSSGGSTDTGGGTDSGGSDSGGNTGEDSGGSTDSGGGGGGSDSGGGTDTGEGTDSGSGTEGTG